MRVIFLKMRMNLIKQIVLGDVFRRIIKIHHLMASFNAFEEIPLTIKSYVTDIKKKVFIKNNYFTK